jgi:hypothetical protein
MANNLSSNTLFGQGYAGFGNLSVVKGNCPFEYYSDDTEFVKDAQYLAGFVAQRLGVGGTGNTTTYITDLTVYAAFEEAVTTYGNMVYQYKIRDNYINMEGSDTLPFVNNGSVIVNSEDVNSRVYWSAARTATWGEIGRDTAYSSSATNGEIYAISASIDDFVAPDIKLLKNYTFPYQTIPTIGTTNLSRVVYNQFNKFAGPTSASIDGNGNTQYTILDGKTHVYFFTNDPNVNGKNTTYFPNGYIPTIYSQNNMKSYELNGKLINNNLQTQIRLAEAYAQEAGVGGYVTEYTGSLTLTPGQQVYDLNAWAAASASIEEGDRIEIRQIFYQEPPAIVRYFDPYAGTGTGVQGLLETFGFGSYSPGINFMLMPVYWDIQKIQAIEFNDQVRKSAFSFDLVNNQLRLFPVPTNESGPLYLLFKYMKVSEKNNILAGSDKSNVISDIMNVPYRNPVYANINQVGRMWIYRYTLALCKEIEGQIRATFQNTAVGAVVVNGSELLTDARTEKADLLAELKEMLNEVSRRSQLEKKQAESEFTRQTMNQIPLLIYSL